MSQAQVGWTSYLYCGCILSGAIEKVQEQILKNVIHNFGLLTTSPFKIKKPLWRGVEISVVLSKKHKIMAKSKTLGKVPNIKATVPSLNATKMTTHSVHRRDEEATGHTIPRTGHISLGRVVA